jgi:hypothetical protein
MMKVGKAHLESACHFKYPKSCGLWISILTPTGSLYELEPASLSVYSNMVEHANFVDTCFASAVSDFCKIRFWLDGLHNLDLSSP